MNTQLPLNQYSHILDAHGNIGEILLRSQQVVANADPLLRNLHFGEFGDPSSHRDTLTGMLRDATQAPEHPIPKGRSAVLARSQFGQWILLIGTPSIRRLMTNIVVGLAQHEDVRVLDCGDQFDPVWAARLVQENTEVFEHILLKQARSCAQVLEILDHTSISPAPFVGLDLLHPFTDDSIDLEERKDILKGCLQNLRRLQLSTGGMVSLCPPRRDSG